MPLSDAPSDGQEQKLYVVDKEMVQRLAQTILEPYKTIAALYVNSPEKKQAKLAEMEAVISETVKHSLAIRHVVNVTKTEITNMGQVMKDEMELIGQAEFTEDNIEQELQRIREKVEAKLEAQSERAEEEKKLPPYFDEWCKATTAEVIRILQQTINGVN